MVQVPGRLQAQDEPKFQFQSKVRKRPISQLEVRQAAGVPITQERVSGFVLFCIVLFCFDLFRPSTGWMRVAHIREDKLPYLVYLFKC